MRSKKEIAEELIKGKNNWIKSRSDPMESVAVSYMYLGIISALEWVLRSSTSKPKKSGKGGWR